MSTCIHKYMHNVFINIYDFTFQYMSQAFLYSNLGWCLRQGVEPALGFLLLSHGQLGEPDQRRSQFDRKPMLTKADGFGSSHDLVPL